MSGKDVAGGVMPDRGTFERYCAACRSAGPLESGSGAVLLVAIDDYEEIQLSASLEELDALTFRLEQGIAPFFKGPDAGFRFGGGMFVAALHGIEDEAGLEARCREIRGALLEGGISVSIGAAMCGHDPERGWHCAYEPAREALGRARKMGPGSVALGRSGPRAPKERPVRVMLVEDQELVKRYLESIVEGSSGFELAASIYNADLADVYCEADRIDLILMDVYTAGGANGLAASERIKKKHPGIRIIIITSMPEVSFLGRAREAGVDSFWYKEFSKEPLLSVMRRTMAGESVYPDRTPELAFGLSTTSEFSERELEVLRELISGDTNEEIAERLFLSRNTVKDYITRMLLKTGFRSRTELAVKARELGIVIRDEEKR